MTHWHVHTPKGYGLSLAELHPSGGRGLIIASPDCIGDTGSRRHALGGKSENAMSNSPKPALSDSLLYARLDALSAKIGEQNKPLRRIGKRLTRLEKKNDKMFDSLNTINRTQFFSQNSTAVLRIRVSPSVLDDVRTLGELEESKVIVLCSSPEALSPVSSRLPILASLIASKAPN